jgi:hypothetical protein
LHLARVAALCSKLRMSIATLRDENDRLKALLTHMWNGPVSKVFVA